MAEYIELEGYIAKEVLKRYLIDKAHFYPVIVKNAIESIPAADVVEVVRCKDCKHSGGYCFGTSHEETLACFDIEEDGFARMVTRVNPNDFCSYGERKGLN